MIIFLLVFLPIYIWFILLVNIYSAPFKTYFKNSIYFYIKTIGWSILFGVLVELPFVIDLIPFQVNPLYISIKYSAIIALIFFYYPALFTILLLYSNSKFDIAINKDLYPEYYRKGLYDLNQQD